MVFPIYSMIGVLLVMVTFVTLAPQFQNPKCSLLATAKSAESEPEWRHHGKPPIFSLSRRHSRRIQENRPSGGRPGESFHLYQGCIFQGDGSNDCIFRNHFFNVCQPFPLPAAQMDFQQPWIFHDCQIVPYQQFSCLYRSIRSAGESRSKSNAF